MTTTGNGTEDHSLRKTDLHDVPQVDEAVYSARKMAKKLGGTLTKERIGKTLKIRIKY